MLLVWAAGLTILAGLFAMTDSALSRVSPARATEIAREGARGAGALQAGAAWRGHHLHRRLLLGVGLRIGAPPAGAGGPRRAAGAGLLAAAGAGRSLPR